MPINTAYNCLPLVTAAPTQIDDDGGAANTIGTPAAMGNTPAALDITHLFIIPNFAQVYSVVLLAGGVQIWRGGPFKQGAGMGSTGIIITLPEPIRVAGGVAMTIAVTSTTGAAGANAVQARIGYKLV